LGDNNYGLGDAFMSGRFELTDGDMMNLFVAAIVAGRETRSIPMEASARLLAGLFDNLKKYFGDDAAKAAERFYRDVQNRFMAHRENDFVTTQQLPLFSERGKSNFRDLYAAYHEGGDGKLREGIEEVVRFGRENPENQDPIRVTGGNGEAMENALVIHCADKELGARAEYWYLNHAFGEIRMKRQSLVNGETGIRYDCMDFETPDGESKTVYFKISRFYGGRMGEQE
jgi:hypothetical protein